MLEQILFVRAVAEGRHINESEALELADGRILTGRLAKEMGLVSIHSMFESAIFCRCEREEPSLMITAYTPDGEKSADVPSGHQFTNFNYVVNVLLDHHGLRERRG